MQRRKSSSRSTSRTNRLVRRNWKLALIDLDFKDMSLRAFDRPAIDRDLLARRGPVFPSVSNARPSGHSNKGKADDNQDPSYKFRIREPVAPTRSNRIRYREEARTSNQGEESESTHGYLEPPEH